MHFLKKKLCVGCYAKGFEIVDLVDLKTQALLHPDDTSHEFVLKKESVKAIAMYRVGGDFLLCYDGKLNERHLFYYDLHLYVHLLILIFFHKIEFAFFVNKEGWRSRPEWIIHWEGNPNSFGKIS